MSPSRSRHNAAWLLPACLGLMSRKTSFHLVGLEVGSGLDLIADYLEREPLYSEEGGLQPGPEEYGQSPYPILSRTGLDPSPAPETSDLFLGLSREPAGPKVSACERPLMADAVASRLPARPGEGLLVFDRGAPDAAAMRKVLAPWGDAGFWAEFSGELRVHRMVGTELKSAVLARAEGERFVLLKGWNFLQPLGPVKPQRVTIEEPPRRS